MAKTTVDILVTRIKRRIDYNITDTDLNNLVIDCINDGLKVMKQLFLDCGFNDEIGAQDTISTVASQNYVALSTETVDFDQPIVLYEKTNDTVIQIIPYDEFVALYPDSSANSSTTPIHAAFFANNLYLGPTPNSVISIYLDYIKLVSDVVSGGTLPFENNYDPLLIAMSVQMLTSWLDSKNAAAIAQANRQVETLKHELIIGASRNIGTRRGLPSRKPEMSYFSPRKVTS